MRGVIALLIVMSSTVAAENVGAWAKWKGACTRVLAGLSRGGSASARVQRKMARDNARLIARDQEWVEDGFLPPPHPLEASMREEAEARGLEFHVLRHGRGLYLVDGRMKPFPAGTALLIEPGSKLVKEFTAPPSFASAAGS